MALLLHSTFANLVPNVRYIQFYLAPRADTKTNSFASLELFENNRATIYNIQFSSSVFLSDSFLFILQLVISDKLKKSNKKNKFKKIVNHGCYERFAVGIQAELSKRGF